MSVSIDSESFSIVENPDDVEGAANPIHEIAGADFSFIQSVGANVRTWTRIIYATNTERAALKAFWASKSTTRTFTDSVNGPSAVSVFINNYVEKSLAPDLWKVELILVEKAI